MKKKIIQHSSSQSVLDVRGKPIIRARKKRKKKHSKSTEIPPHIGCKTSRAYKRTIFPPFLFIVYYFLDGVTGVLKIFQILLGSPAWYGVAFHDGAAAPDSFLSSFALNGNALFFGWFRLCKWRALLFCISIMSIEWCFG